MYLMTELCVERTNCSLVIIGHFRRVNLADTLGLTVSISVASAKGSSYYSTTDINTCAANIGFTRVIE